MGFRLAGWLTIGAASLGLAGCAQQFMADAQASCDGFGFVRGTPAYAQCVQTQFNERQAALQRALAGASTPTYPGYQMPATSTPATYQGRDTCFSRGERIDGLNKMCFYDCISGRMATTIGAAQLCPISITR